MIPENASGAVPGNSITELDSVFGGNGDLSCDSTSAPNKHLFRLRWAVRSGYVVAEAKNKITILEQWHDGYNGC